MHKRLLTLIILSSLTFLSIIIFPNKTEAISNALPETGNPNHYLLVSEPGNGNALSAPITFAKVYFRSNSGTVIIFDSNHCPYSRGGIDSNGVAPTRYSSFRTDANENWNLAGLIQTRMNSVNQTPGPVWGTNMCGATSIAFSGLTRSSLHPDYYVGVFAAKHEGGTNSGGVNAFKLAAVNADTSSAYIATYSDPGMTSTPGDPGAHNSFFAIQDRIGSNASRSTFRFDFSPPCSWTPRTAYLKWRDADYGQGNQGTSPPI